MSSQSTTANEAFIYEIAQRKVMFGPRIGPYPRAMTAQDIEAAVAFDLKQARVKLEVKL